MTIFGESAGSASIGHLLLSDVTTGLFAQGIGQSGSALASWAFDAHPEQHALEIASKVGCIMAENGVTSHDDLVACLRELPATNISHAFNDYMKEDRLAGGMGFGGSIPCAQTKGEKRFYTSDQTPEKLLHSGHYEKVSALIFIQPYFFPFFAGSNENLRKLQKTKLFGLLVNIVIII